MRSYQLYLSTMITSPNTNDVVPINNTNKANCTWQVNFRALFGNDYGKYKRCSVRCSLISVGVTVATPASILTNFGGYVSINLPSTYCASTSKGTVLSAFVIQNSGFTDTGSPICYFNVNTLGNVQGVDINMPSENQFLNIQVMNDDNFNLMSNVPDYQILLQFELSEPFE